MITLSNGHRMNYVVASGALAFSGKGWFWERPLVWLGLIKPELFTVVIKSLTLNPVKGNLYWWNPLTWLPFSPWSCVRFLPGGVVNKVGLTNKDFYWWCTKIAPKIDFEKYRIIVSLYGRTDELITMTNDLLLYCGFKIAGIELNLSCPNSGHKLAEGEEIVRGVREVKRYSKLPIGIKLGVHQDYLTIIEGLHDQIEWVSINSVPIEMVYKDGIRPLQILENKVGGGGGGVSGKPAQYHNWAMIEAIAKQGLVPVIGASIMEFKDMEELRSRGAKAIAFGSIHLRTPWEPTSNVEKDMRK